MEIDLELERAECGENDFPGINATHPNSVAILYATAERSWFKKVRLEKQLVKLKLYMETGGRATRKVVDHANFTQRIRKDYFGTEEVTVLGVVTLAKGPDFTESQFHRRFRMSPARFASLHNEISDTSWNLCFGTSISVLKRGLTTN